MLSERKEIGFILVSCNKKKALEELERGIEKRLWMRHFSDHGRDLYKKPRWQPVVPECPKHRLFAHFYLFFKVAQSQKRQMRIKKTFLNKKEKLVPKLVSQEHILTLFLVYYFFLL